MFHKISSKELAKVGHALGRGERLRHQVSQTKEAAVKAGETVLGGMAAGYARGKMEDANGQWLIPGTTLDVELAAGAAMTLVPLVGPLLGLDVFGDYEHDVVAGGSGILSHYLGQAARNFAKTGNLSWPLVAGAGGTPILGGRTLVGAPDIDAALSALTPR